MSLIVEVYLQILVSMYLALSQHQHGSRLLHDWVLFILARYLHAKLTNKVIYVVLQNNILQSQNSYVRHADKTASKSVEILDLTCYNIYII